MIFVDADFFIGLYHREDHHHKTCLKLLDKIGEEIITSWDVIDETVTKLIYRTEKKFAILFIEDLLNKHVIIVYPNSRLFTKAYKFLLQQQSKHVSLTDCMNMTIAKEYKITQFLSFDEIYLKNGFTLIT